MFCSCASLYIILMLLCLFFRARSEILWCSWRCVPRQSILERDPLKTASASLSSGSTTPTPHYPVIMPNTFVCLFLCSFVCLFITR